MRKPGGPTHALHTNQNTTPENNFHPPSRDFHCPQAPGNNQSEVPSAMERGTVHQSWPTLTYTSAKEVALVSGTDVRFQVWDKSESGHWPGTSLID